MPENLSQTKTPILDTLRDCADKFHAPFYAPGHKRGQGISSALINLLGAKVFQADLPELPELDNLFAPEGVLLEAQILASETFGADQTWFLVNGSTCGIIAAILATCQPGDKIILPRNVHQSAISGLILSGAIPIFINPEYDAQWDITYSITAESVADALRHHPDAKAVMMVYPTYHGVCGDIAKIAEIVHQYNIPLLVDEAHGAHFNFHPDLPISGLKSGADLTVQSIHKVLGAMTQASMLHVKHDRVNSQRVSRALQLVESTSPSYLLLASLDAARQQMALEGNALMSHTLALADKARSFLSQIPGLSVLQLSKRSPGFVNLDKTRLTVKVSDLGITGFEGDQILNEELGVTAELPLLHHLTFIISLGNTEADIDNLVKAFINLEERMKKRKGGEKRDKILGYSFVDLPLPIALTPREAFFSMGEMVSREKAKNRISAELICPYPPGIPILMPGEIITPDALDYLEQVLALGGRITGCDDPTLQTLKVVRN
jgi:arginine/lysine/ornithine decarboxylase